MLDIAGERRQQTIRIAARRLDLDHIGAEIGQLPRRIGRRNIAQLDHAQMTERGFAAGIACFCQVITVLHDPKNIRSPRRTQRGGTATETRSISRKDAKGAKFGD